MGMTIPFSIYLLGYRLIPIFQNTSRYILDWEGADVKGRKDIYVVHELFDAEKKV